MAYDPERLAKVRETATCLCDEATVNKACDTMAEAITAQYADKNPLFLLVMTGGFIAGSEVIMRLDFPLQIDYVHVTRYTGELRPGDLHWRIEPRFDLTDRHVIIVDDVLDGGLTLAAIKDYCAGNKAASVATAVLVDKDHPREAGGVAHADYTGLFVEDRYIFGYGLDYHDYLRNARGIYAVADEYID